MERDLGKFLQLLYTFEHEKAMALFSSVAITTAEGTPTLLGMLRREAFGK